MKKFKSYKNIQKKIIQKEIQSGKKTIDNIINKTEEALIIVSDSGIVFLGNKVKLFEVLKTLAQKMYEEKVFTKDEMLKIINFENENSSSEKAASKGESVLDDIIDLIKILEKLDNYLED